MKVTLQALVALERKRLPLAAKGAAIIARAEAERDGELTDEEVAQLEVVTRGIDPINAEIARFVAAYDAEVDAAAKRRFDPRRLAARAGSSIFLNRRS